MGARKLKSGTKRMSSQEGLSTYCNVATEVSHPISAITIGSLAGGFTVRQTELIGVNDEWPLR